MFDWLEGWMVVVGFVGVPFLIVILQRIGNGTLSMFLAGFFMGASGVGLLQLPFIIGSLFRRGPDLPSVGYDPGGKPYTYGVLCGGTVLICFLFLEFFKD